MNNKNTALVALGTNLPHRDLEGPALLAQAVIALQTAGLTPLKLSGVWRSPAWPPSDQPDYFNAVVLLDHGQRTPQQLYATLRQIEQSFGRERRERWSARTLDLDLIAMNESVGTFGDVELPHPRAHDRAFVLAPLAEVDPAWRHPVLMTSAADLLADLGAHDARRVGSLEAPGAR